MRERFGVVGIEMDDGGLMILGGRGLVLLLGGLAEA